MVHLKKHTNKRLLRKSVVSQHWAAVQLSIAITTIPLL